MTSTKFTIAETVRITGKSRTTIDRHMKNGTLPYEVNAHDKRIVDASDITRVYGNDLHVDRADPVSKRSANNAPASDQALHRELKHVQEQLERERQERTREREHYESQVDYLEQSFEREQEGHNRATLLLKNHTERGGDWEKPFEALKLQVANHEKEQQELKEIARRKITRLQQELAQEKSKSWFQKMLG